MGADFKNARLTGTILRGADLTDAVNLTFDQIESAIIDDDTKLPDYVDRRSISRRIPPVDTPEVQRASSVDFAANPPV